MPRVSDCRFVGGPYNGNYFYVPDENDKFVLSSHSGSYSTQHLYSRFDDATFTYQETNTNDPSN